MKTCFNPRCTISLPLAPTKDEQGNEFCGENCKRETQIYNQRAQASVQGIKNTTTPIAEPAAIAAGTPLIFS
jgi:hypothetical protein